jgi:hypothetical protein
VEGCKHLAPAGEPPVESNDGVASRATDGGLTAGVDDTTERGWATTEPIAERFIFVPQQFEGELMYVEEHEQYRCEACGRQFDSERALRAHVRSVGLVD